MLALACALLLGACGGRSRPRALGRRPSAGPQYGANVNYLFTYRNQSEREIELQLRELQATGATIARTDSLWEATEPAPPRSGRHTYDWSFDDHIAADLAAAGLRWQPIIDYTAGWAESVPGQEHSPPTSDAAYAAYAGAFAARYGTGGTFWRAHPRLPALPVETYEIWNEPDNHIFWYPRADPASYAALYHAAHDAIRAAQPQARVIVGGLDDVVPFVPAMLAADPGLRTAIDGVGIHPYAADPGAVLAKVIGARVALGTAGLGATPLYVTEVGWTTSPAGAPQYVPAVQRPADIGALLDELSHGRCGVASLVIYTWVSPDRDPSNDQDWYGLNPPSGGGSADVSAFAAALQRAAAPGAAAACGQ